MNGTTTTDKKYAAWKDAEIPIIIGVSAHRDIRQEHVPEIKDKVRKVLNDVKALCPNSPVYMLNGLAKGGDQLCADVAVDLGIKLIVALPFDEDKYINPVDFPLGTDLHYAKYERDGHVKEKFVVPDTEKQYGDALASEKSRNYLFRQQGIYVATNCHLLLALWDGEKVVDKRKECGTNAAIGFALNHSYYQPNGTEFSPSDDGAVARIFAPRDSGTYGEIKECPLTYYVPTEITFEVENAKNNQAGSESKYYDEYDDIPPRLAEILMRTDGFNRDYHEYCAELKKPENIRDGQYLLDKSEYDRAVVLGNKARAMVDCHNVASKLSSINKKKNLRAIMALAVMGMLLLLSFMVYDQLSFLWTAAISLVTLVILILTYALVYAGEKRSAGGVQKRGRTKIKFDVHERFIEYRALSEALRVQYYMTMYGIEDCVCRYFTWSHKSVMPWVRRAVIALNAGKTVAAWEGAEAEYVDNGGDRVIKSDRHDARGVFENKLFVKWIGHSKYEMDYNGNGQIGYHLKSVSEKGKAIKKRNVINKCALSITLCAYVLLYVCELLPFVDLGSTIAWIFNWRMLLKSVLSTFAAITFLLTYYYGKQSLDLIRSDSVNMVKLYRIALDRANKIYQTFDKTKDCNAAMRSLVCELAREQLIENVTWVAYNRDNNIEMPM